MDDAFTIGGVVLIGLMLVMGVGWGLGIAFRAIGRRQPDPAWKPTGYRTPTRSWDSSREHGRAEREAQRRSLVEVQHRKIAAQLSMPVPGLAKHGEVSRDRVVEFPAGRAR